MVLDSHDSRGKVEREKEKEKEEPDITSKI